MSNDSLPDNSDNKYLSEIDLDNQTELDAGFVIGIKIFELFIPESNSLKHKRMVVKGLKDRLRARFNVSVAEVEYNDLWQRSIIAVSAISNNARRIDRLLEKIDDLVESEHRLVVINTQTELF